MGSGLAALSGRTDEWIRAAREDDQLGEFVRDASVVVGIGDDEHVISVTVDRGSLTVGGVPEFTLVTGPAAWEAHFQACPPAPYHHFLAMRMRVPGTRVDGDERRFAQHVHVARRLLEIARHTLGGHIKQAPDSAIDRAAIRGYYLAVPVGSGKLDIYVEEAGNGSPIVVLHTAGADSRQAHPLMADEGVTRRYRVIAFDLPGHGRSDPAPGPVGSWSLTAELYGDVIEGVVDHLALESPILVGASMAGEACLLMAYRAPKKLGGVVACEAADHVPGRSTPWAGTPEVNEAVFVPEWIYGLIGPQAPSACRDAIWRIYSQGGHRTFAGDIDFYSGGWDGRGLVERIDTSDCPVVMMTGQYDYSCTPEMSRATAERIPGAHFWEMAGLGHFPICENPVAFRPHLDRALSVIGGYGG